MKTRRLYYQRPLSLFLATVMTVSNFFGSVSVLADDPETEIVAVEENTETGEEPAIVEEPEYHVMLPVLDGCTYSYDSSHFQKKTESCVVLDYHPYEEVKLGVDVLDPYHITDFHLQDANNHEAAYNWNPDQGKLSFQMPDSDLHLSIALEQVYQEVPVESEIPLEELTVTEEVVFEEQTQAEEEPLLQTEQISEETVITEENGGQEVTDEEMQEPGSEEALLSAEKEEEPVTEITQSVSDPVEQMTEASALEEAQEQKPAQDYEIVIEADGLPTQGSIVQVDTLSIPYDTWDFDPKTDFSHIAYDRSEVDITYISDDFDFVNPGTYSSIYRIQQKATERMWYVLRPVRVCEKSEVLEPMTESSLETEAPAAETGDEKTEPDEDPAPGEQTESSPETETVTEQVTEALTTSEEPETQTETGTEVQEEQPAEDASETLQTECSTEEETPAFTEEAQEEPAEETALEDPEILLEEPFTEQEPEPDFSVYEVVTDEEMYYLTLPEIGATEVLKKHLRYIGCDHF